MIKFETEFECKTEQEVIYALQHIIDRIESGYRCGYLTDSSAEGDWGMSGEEDFEEEDEREVYVKWDVSDSEFETFADEGIPHRVWVPTSVDEEDITDWLSDEYGYCVESWYFMDEV